jgi:hypothetical protein
LPKKLTLTYLNTETQEARRRGVIGLIAIGSYASEPLNGCVENKNKVIVLLLSVVEALLF